MKKIIIRYFLNHQAFTLIEVMMVVGILGIALSIFYNFIGFNLDFMSSRNYDNDSYLNARTAMSRVLRELQKYQELKIANVAVDPLPPVYVLEGVTYKNNPVDKLINCTDVTDTTCIFYLTEVAGGIGQLYKSDNKVAEKISINVIPDDTSDPVDSLFIIINIEAFPSYNANMNSIKLSTKLRLNRLRPNLSL